MLYRTRRTQVVQLHARDGAPTPNVAGLFVCEIVNAASEMVFIYVGVYPQGEGKGKGLEDSSYV